MCKNVVICPICLKEFEEIPYSSPFQYRGIFHNFKIPDNFMCPKCNSSLVETNITMNELQVIFSVSHNNDFIKAMIDLKEKDPIEYQAKISQFKTQLEQQKQIKQVKQESNVPKCPTCGSTDIKKISIGKKAFGGWMFGLFSSDVRNTMRCGNCGYKW